MKFIPLLVTLASTLGAFFLTPSLVAAHPGAFAAVGAGAQILHAALPSVFGGSN